MIHAPAVRCRYCGATYEALDDSGACGVCQATGERCQCGRLLTPAERECGQGCCDACVAECERCGERLPDWQRVDVDGYAVCAVCAEGGF